MIETIETIETRILARLGDGQGRAYDDDLNSCVYRTKEGVGCAVGCLILDHYDPGIEGANISSLGIKDGKWVGRIVENRVKLAAALNASNIPASSDIVAVLKKWQRYHDAGWHWIGKKYIGPKF
jgi:hypothetical protein